MFFLSFALITTVIFFVICYSSEAEAEMFLKLATLKSLAILQINYSDNSQQNQ